MVEGLNDPYTAYFDPRPTESLTGVCTVSMRVSVLRLVSGITK